MNDNELKALLGRFMDGQTTIDEERRLAEHFRNNDVSEDLAPYKTMFAWFDEGMPLDGAEPKPTIAHESKAEKRSKRTMVVTLLTAAAAAVALFMLITLTQNAGREGTHLLNQSQQTAEAKPIATADTLTADTTREQTQKPARRRRRPMRNPYALPHPTTLMAEAERDSINVIANRMAEERLRQVEREQALRLGIIEAQFSEQSQGIELMMAALESGDYYADEEEIDEY